MQALYNQFNQLLELTPMNFFREQHDTINWDVRILGILGQKGVGKSTLILQHIKRAGNEDESLYIVPMTYISAPTPCWTPRRHFLLVEVNTSISTKYINTKTGAPKSRISTTAYRSSTSCTPAVQCCT